MRPQAPLRDIRFRNPQIPELQIELLTLESLFRRKLDHQLEAPQRVQFYLILFFTSGIGVHYVDFAPYAYDDSTLMFIARGQVQQYQVNLANRGYVLLFTPEFLYQNATELNLIHSLQVFDDSLHTPKLALPPEQRDIFLRLFDDLHREYQRPGDSVKEEILRHLLRLVLMQAERIRRASALSQTIAPFYQEFVAFRELVRRDFARSRSVRYYADQLAISPKKLNGLTRAVLNKTAKVFIEEQVILEARRLLAQGTLPIKELAYHLGFDEPTNLVKFFKKHTRLSPAAFRRRFQAQT